jgi:hypothetical protein
LLSAILAALSARRQFDETAQIRLTAFFTGA